MTSLESFAKEQGTGRRCVTCRLPAEMLTELEAARLQDPAVRPSYATIAAWLASEGEKISAHSVKYHFSEGHQNRG